MRPREGDVTPCRVVLADDEPRLLDALRAALESTDRIEVVAAAGSGPEAEHACLQHEPDVVVLDVHMPGGGIPTVRRLKQRRPALRVVVLSADETPAVRTAARAAGADAVLSKASDDVTAAVLGEGVCPA